MSTRPLRKQGGGDEDSFRQQSNTENALAGLRSSLIIDGGIVEDVTVGSTPTLISHRLGRPIRGYIIVKNNTFAHVANVIGTFDKNLFINLVASSACVISLWIF